METFEEYLAAKRTQSNGNGVLHGAKGESVQKAAEAVRNARSHMRAVKNWRRAKYAVTKKITEDMLGMQRKCGHFFTMLLNFSYPNAHCNPQRLPPSCIRVALLLGARFMPFLVFLLPFLPAISSRLLTYVMHTVPNQVMAS